MIFILFFICQVLKKKIQHLQKDFGDGGGGGRGGGEEPIPQIWYISRKFFLKLSYLRVGHD